MNNDDKVNALQNLKEEYKMQYKKFGESPKALMWYSDKMNIRFSKLFEEFKIGESDQVTFLDIGCGFGHFNKFLKQKSITKYTYLGIDMVEEFIKCGQTTYQEDDRVDFRCDNFLVSDITEKYDYVIISGIFNNRLNSDDESNYRFLFDTVSKAFSVASKAVAFNFYTDKVDYKKETMAYHSPECILEFAYGLSRKVIFKNDYMPFEATMTIFVDDTFRKDWLIFDSFVKENHSQFDSGFFRVDK